MKKSLSISFFPGVGRLVALHIVKLHQNARREDRSRMERRETIQVKFNGERCWCNIEGKRVLLSLISSFHSNQ